MARLDLDALRPANSTFTHRGVEYEIPAELAVETIVEALQLREKFEDAQRADDEQAMVVAMSALRGIVRGLIDEARPAGREGDPLEPAQADALQSLFPAGTTVSLPDGRTAAVLDGGGVRVSVPAYPRLSVEEITRVLTLAMGGDGAAAIPETPEDVVARKLAPDLDGEEHEGEEPGPTSSATDFVATPPEPAQAV